MAGGEYGRVVACGECASRAERTAEGAETDLYACEQGHVFGIDWSYDGPPSSPQWPPTPEFLASFAAGRALLEGQGPRRPG